MPPTPFSVQIAVLTPDEDRVIQFGLSRGVNTDETVFWTIDFAVSVRRNGRIRPFAEVHLTLGPSQSSRAEALAFSKGLSAEKLSLLENQVSDRVACLTKEEIPRDAALRDLLLKLV